MEHDPLFKPGFHNIKIDEIESLFVKPFNNTSCRKYLVERLKVFLSELRKVGIKFEVWLDGSFATLKPDPNDVDIAVIGDMNEIKSLNLDKKNILVNLFENPTVTKLRYSCEVYFIYKEDKKNQSW